MADFDKINIDAVSYNVKDTTARQQIADEIAARKQADTIYGGDVHVYSPTDQTITITGR